MDANSRKQLGGLLGLVLLIVVGIAAWTRNQRDSIPQVTIPDDGKTIYYTGPMRGKGNTAGLPDGSEVKLPPRVNKPTEKSKDDLTEEEKDKT